MSMDEVGGTVHSIFHEQATEALQYAQVVNDVVADMQARFTQATEGCNSMHIESITTDLSRVLRGLGDAATALVRAQTTSGELLAEWGVTTDRPAPLDTPLYVNAKLQLYNARLTTLLDPDDGQYGGLRVTMSRLSNQGLSDIRDVIVAGKSRLYAIGHVSREAIDRLVDRIQERMPDMPVTASRNPSIAALLYSSLDEIPITIFRPMPEQLRMSVQTLVTTPPDQLPGGAWWVDKWRPIRDQALLFAEQFKQAKQRSQSDLAK
jgi:hypothetical protein